MKLVSPSAPGVLIVDSDAEALAPLVYEFARRSYRVRTASTAREAMEALWRSPPDLVLLSAELRGATGLSVLRSIRRAPETRRLPVIVLTASNGPDERIHAFQAGADDGVGRPIDPEEVALRAEALLRRSDAGLQPQHAGVLKVGPLEIDDAAKEVSLHGKELGLSPNEYRLLLALAQCSGRIQSRERLRNVVWGDEAINLRAVDRVIATLRGRLGETRDWIESVKGFGYRMRAEV